MIVLVSTHHGPLADSRAVELDDLLASNDRLRGQEPAIRFALAASGGYRIGGDDGTPEIIISIPHEEHTP